MCHHTTGGRNRPGAEYAVRPVTGLYREPSAVRLTGGVGSGAATRRADVVAEHPDTIGVAATHDPVQGTAAAKQSVCVKPGLQVKRGEKQQDQAGVGLFTYPVLQAADILVYR